MGISDADPYENIYAVIRGHKHFTLMPPTEGFCLRGICAFQSIVNVDTLQPCLGIASPERLYPHATYVRPRPDAQLEIKPTVKPDGTDEMISWASVDPTATLLETLDGQVPDENAHPIEVIVEPGEALYLPPGWWHHVRQSGHIVIAVNWWYDMEMRSAT